MKATQKNFDATLARVLRDVRVFYFCGQDEAGASDAAARVAAGFAAAEKVELAGADLRKDPVLLADEARSVSLFGDSRVIHVRTAGDEACEAIETLLASPVAGWPVLVVATSASDKSRIAKLLADRSDALVAVFHPPELASVVGSVRKMADAAGVRLTTDLAEQIARASALDTRMARSEMEKIALYLDADPQAPRTATATDLAAIAAVSEDDSVQPLVSAVLSGNAAKLPAELMRLRELELNPVGVLLAFERRTAQLVQLAGRMGARSDINGFLETEISARRVHFRDKAELMQQLRRWRGRKLERLVERLFELHRRMLGDNRNAELALAQGLADIARAAAR